MRIFKIRAPHAILVLLLMMAIIKFSHLAARLMNMAISRNREYLADASAVHLCKDPAALASALHKIAFSARNFLSTENNVASMFIVHPCLNALDEDSGLVSDLFSTHPPMHKRLEKLLTWAKTSLSQLKVTKPAPSNVSKDAYFRWGSGQWLGPLNAEDLLADSHLSVNDWIAGPMGILKAVDYAFLKDKFQGNLVSQAKEAGVLETASPYSCPRCKLNLYEVRYEGLKVYHCLMCKGYLLAKNYLSRLVVRDLRVFTPQETKEARIWRMTRGRQIGELCVLEAINCPFCKDMMSKIIYSETSKVVIDRCQNASCASVWCDAGELEKVQILSHSEDESFTRN